MNNYQNLNIYLILAFIIHAVFLISFSLSKSINDITTVGETGMAIQMMFIQKSDEVYDKSITSDEIRNKIDDEKKDEQVLLDNRAVGDKSNHTYDTYYGRVRQIIDSNKNYPLLSRQRKEQGSPIVKFIILKDGSVDNLSVISSGYRSLDREARRMIAASSPFPAVPDSISKTGITLTIPINFTLNEY